MATTKVSALAETTSPQANDELLLNQSGVSKKVKITNLGIGTPADNSVSTQKIANDAVTIAKLNLISTSSAPSLEAKGTSNSTSGYIQLNCSENSHGIKLLGPPHSAGANYTLTFPNNDGDANQKLTTNGSGVLTWTADSTTDNTKLPLSGGQMTGNITFSGAQTVDGVDISARNDVLTITTNTANAALPKAGGTMTGNLVMGTNLVDGVDISARDAVLTSTTTTAGAALPKAGGTMTGTITSTNATALQLTNNTTSKIHFGDSGNASIGKIEYVHSSNHLAFKVNDAERMRITSAGQITVSNNAVGTLTTDNDGSFAMSASNNFKCTPAGNFALTFTSIVAQSGNILFINSGGHTISAHANTKVDATFLATISTAGTYLLSYFSDGTNVYMTNSAAYT